MKIKEIYENKNPVFSFEIFPPNKNFPEEKLKEVTKELSTLKPDFISVTYGAGGTTKSGTVEIASYIKNTLRVETLSHLTCIGSKKEEIIHFLKELKENNIKNILALRGDIPHGKDESIYEQGDYKYASDLIKDIKENDNFSIGAAFYPETHYENNDLIDLIHLKEKVDMGADFLAGIMPVTNAAQIKRITSLCKSKIPLKLEKILDKYGNNPESMKKAGIAYATEQIIELMSNDIKGVHLYTMNKTDTTREILNNINFVR